MDSREVTDDDLNVLYWRRRRAALIPLADSEKWEWLMFCARMHARIYNERARVIAIALPERAVRLRGTRWAYVIDQPSEAARG